MLVSSEGSVNVDDKGLSEMIFHNVDKGRLALADLERDISLTYGELEGLIGIVSSNLRSSGFGDGNSFAIQKDPLSEPILELFILFLSVTRVGGHVSVYRTFTEPILNHLYSSNSFLYTSNISDLSLDDFTESKILDIFTKKGDQKSKSIKDIMRKDYDPEKNMEGIRMDASKQQKGLISKYIKLRVSFEEERKFIGEVKMHKEHVKSMVNQICRSCSLCDNRSALCDVSKFVPFNRSINVLTALLSEGISVFCRDRRKDEFRKQPTDIEFDTYFKYHGSLKRKSKLRRYDFSSINIMGGVSDKSRYDKLVRLFRDFDCYINKICAHSTGYFYAYRDGSINKNRSRSFGRPLPGTKIRIGERSESDSLGPNDKGKVFVKGPQILSGIKGDTFQYERPDEDGFIYTGCKGYIDEKGHLYLESEPGSTRPSDGTGNPYINVTY